MLNLEKKMVILDRDGVINIDSLDYIKSPEEFTPIEGSLEAIARLKKMDFKIFIATNQSGVGRGYFTREILDSIHAKLSNLLLELNTSIDGIYYCPHAPVDKCRCRKPLPGMLQMIASDTGVDLTGIPFVGDSMRDIKAGWAVGCESILVKSGKGIHTLENHAKELDRVSVFENLAACVNQIELGYTTDHFSLI